MNKKILFIFLIIYLIIINGCTKTSIPPELQKKNISKDIKIVDEETTPASPMKVELFLSKAPALGEIAEVTAVINYTAKIKDNMPETTANIILPDGFELISGTSTWSGYLKKEPTQFSITVRAIQIGNWTIEANARNAWFYRVNRAYVSVLEDKGIISKEPFPLPKIEGVDRAIKMNESEIPPETEPPLDENITIPKPTEPILRTLTPPMKVELFLSKAPALGEIAEVTAVINYTAKIKDNMPETTANIILPDGFELISGTSTWSGYLKKEPIVN